MITPFLHGTYRSRRTQTIEFSANEIEGALIVNGIAQGRRTSWNFAGGSAVLPLKTVSPILSQGPGHLLINASYSNGQLELDFSDVTKPVRKCTPELTCKPRP
jgi:hypothetical protein